MRDLGQEKYSGIYSFLGLPATTDISEDTDCVIYGMPMDIGTTNRAGTRFGPKTIRRYGSCKPYHEELGIDIFDDFKAIDYGDMKMSEGYIIDDMTTVINTVEGILEKGVKTIGIGGDHTLAYPELVAMKHKYGKVALIHFDSHTDTWEWPAANDTTLINHATPFRLAMERECLAEGHIVQVGMRGGLLSDKDHEYALTHGFRIITGNEVHDMGMDTCAKEIRKTVGDMPVFVTFDIDFLDPAYAPGTGTPVCGGFSTAEALTLLRKSLPGLNIVGMDIVEVAPEYDPTEATAYAAQAILREFVSVLSYNKKNK